MALPISTNPKPPSHYVQNPKKHHQPELESPGIGTLNRGERSRGQKGQERGR